MDVRIIAVYMILLVGNIEAAGKCNSPVNIAAVIDVSDNLSPSNLPEIKNFLKRVANFFLLSTHASHMSVILAGSQVNVAIDPVSGVGSSKARFIKAVETSVKHSGGAWSVDEGLGLAKKVFTGSRNFVPRVALVLTNGRQSNGNRSDVLKSRARDLHAMGVYVYVVSVGDRVSRDELRLMVKDDSEYLYHVDHFKDLDTLAVNVSSDICQKHYIGSFAVCKTKVDVGVIVDSSGSIRSDEYLGVKKFVQAISVYMGFLPVNGTHIGVVVYSKDARVWTKFGQQANFRKLFRVLGRMPHYRDLTRIDLGLDVANTKLFTKEDGMREDAHKIAILFTDGEQTTENVNDLIPLKEVASRLKDRGIVLFAVGIGEKVKRSQLLEIASGEEYVIMIESFSALRESATKIAALACQVVDPPVINFTQSVYDVNEDRKAVIGISVTQGKVIAPLTVSIHPSPATANNDDFFASVQNVTFQPGETRKQIEIEVVDDLKVEPTESFVLSLASSSSAILGEPSSVNIIDNDAVINFTRPVFNVREDEGKARVGISVTTGVMSKPVTVRITPKSDTADKDDFDSTPKDVTFQAGETGPKYVNFDLIDDTYYEPTEKFTVSLSSNSRVVLGGPSTVNIQDDDLPPPPMIEFTQPSYSASESGKVPVAISVTRDKVTEPVTVRVTPRRDTAGEDDFDSTPKDVTFQPGETGPKYVNIDLIDDTDYEPTEKFTVSLSSNSRVLVGGPSTINIQDDDLPPPPMIEFTQPSYSASESGKVPVAISVTRNKVTEPVTVRVTPRRGTAGEDDFDSTPKDVTFQPGETGPKYVNIDLINDPDDEPMENFTVSLSSNSRVLVGGPSTVNIQDDDVAKICGTSRDDCDENALCADVRPGYFECFCNDGYAGDGKYCAEIRIGFTKSEYDVNEDDGAAEVQLIVTSGAITKPVTVTVQPEPDTASSLDFNNAPVKVTFQPGQKGPKSVVFDIIDDNEVEEDESVKVSLSSGDPVGLDKPTYVRIVDNDEPICKTDKHNCHKFAVCNDTGPGLHECTCQEGYSGDGKSCQVISFRFTNPVYDVRENEKPFVEIQLGTGEITKPVDIEVRTIMGTADDEDFIPVSKFVTFQPGERKKSVGIDLVDDDVVEPTEEFTVRLSSSTRAAFGSPATVRIADNDAEICDMDIGFLVDSTASMRDCNFKKEKDFVKKIAGYFQVAPGATRTSTIVYGGDALLAKKFNETKSLKDFQTEIDNIPFKGGRANLDAAMHLAASGMFTVKNGMRENVPKVLVVVNDGAQKVITQSAKDISSMLRKNEVRVIVIGIGEAEHDLLAQIVASPEDLIMTEKFDDATENLVSLFKRICSKRDNSSCRILKKKVDDLKIGGCMSEKPVEIGVCGGHCSSFSNFVKRNGFYEMDCGCCKAKTKVTVTVDLKCSMNTYQAFKIRSAESCSCESCESRPVEIIKK